MGVFRSLLCQKKIYWKQHLLKLHFNSSFNSCPSSVLSFHKVLCEKWNGDTKNRGGVSSQKLSHSVLHWDANSSRQQQACTIQVENWDSCICSFFIFSACMSARDKLLWFCRLERSSTLNLSHSYMVAKQIIQRLKSAIVQYHPIFQYGVPCILDLIPYANWFKIFGKLKILEIVAVR